MNELLLAVTPEPTYSLSLTSLVDILRWSEQGGKEDGMIGTREIGTTCAFVHDVQKEDALCRIVLIPLQALGSLRGRSLDLEELDLVSSESLSDFLHEIRKLDEDENSFVFRYAPPVHKMSVTQQVIAMRHT